MLSQLKLSCFCPFYIIVAIPTFCLPLHLQSFDVIEYLVQTLLLILGGDVELNPGPGKSEYQHKNLYKSSGNFEFHLLNLCVNQFFHRTKL